MGARVRRWLSSLGARLLVPLYLAVAVVLSVHAVVSFRSIQDQYRGFVAAESNRSSGLIRRATHDGMLLNRLQEVQSVIERIADGSEVSAIRVYDRHGTIVLSSEPTEIGATLDVEAAPCASCHGDVDGATPALRGASALTSMDDEPVYRQLSVIENEPACSATGCHADAAREPVLGVLDVSMSMLPVQAAVSSARNQLVTTTVILMLALGLVSAVIFRRLVHRPIRSLEEGTLRIAGGDLDTRIQVEGDHELARLARDFNRMAADLGRARIEVTEWSRTLEDKVREKTDELRQAQRQVLHMEKMGSLGKLSATVAHEINNPISGVLTYARLVERELADQPLPDAARTDLEHYLHLIQRECSRCGEIVQNLLVFARRTGSEMRDVDVNDVLQRSLMLVRHHLEIRGMELSVSYLDGDAALWADPGQLEQALVALFVNAVEAMDAGGTLTVSARGDDEYVHVEVADTGSGIPPEVLPQIFEPFFSTKSGESGVGLGLAVTFGIVHRHEGTIQVDSTVGVGTTFHIRLKRRPADEGGEAVEGSLAAAGPPVAGADA